MAIGVRSGIVRVSVDFVGLVSFVFHWWWIDCSFLRLRNVLQWSIVGFALTAIGSFVWAGNGVG